MELPIHLEIESDSIWTTYREERDTVNDLASLRKFVLRWQDIYPFKVDEEMLAKLTEETIKKIKTEKVDKYEIILNIILPDKIFRAMMIAKEHIVPLNCAFIQANGGLEAFE